MKKPTIVAPGGSYTKAIVAAQYGAEEVYIGVPFTSLRMRQNKISGFEELKKTVDALHALGSKALLTMNIFPRNQDITIFEKTVEQIANVGADAIIFSDPGTFNIIRKYMPDTPLHLSTQASTLNHSAVQFWYDLGVKRIVLARELSLAEIKEIKEKVPGMELEVFVHGAMCMSYSGRCLLGDYMNGRPGNKGECSHACRFKYKVRLEEERRPGKLFQLEGDEDGSHVLSSKDLCVIQRLAEIMPYVDAMKIEGRSKSEFYVASVVKAYTHMRDSILANKEPDLNIVDLVNKIPHRAYWDGFLFNPLKDFPETEEISEDKQQKISEDRISEDKRQTMSDDKTEKKDTIIDEKITFDIIGAAMKIHNQLGPALLEKVYKKGLKHELQKLGYRVKEETKVNYTIDDEVVGSGHIDLIVNDSVALELKSTKLTKGDYYKQLRSYMQNNSEIEVGLLLNFYNKSLDYKRLDKGFKSIKSSKPSDGNHQTSSASNHQTSITYDTAGPLFNRNYFGVFTNKYTEHDNKKYFAIDPKEVLEPGMKIKYISPESMGELSILDMRNEQGHQLEKVNCNTGEVYVLTDVDLQGWEILYM